MNALNVSTLVPGLMVSLKTSVRGGVAYNKQDIEKTAAYAKWITDKTVADPAEHEKAVKLRNKCSTLIRGACSLSSFGLLCRQDNAWKLEDAMAEARAICADFNKTSRYTKITVNVLIGRIADNDAEAAKAIRAEVSDLIADMQAGIAELNVEKVRAAADKAKSVGKMLSPDAFRSVESAVKAARDIATKINKAGEAAAEAIDAETLAKLTRARTEFLDVPEVGEALAAVEPIAVDGESRGIDIDPSEPAPADGFGPEPGAARAFDLPED